MTPEKPVKAPGKPSKPHQPALPPASPRPKRVGLVSAAVAFLFLAIWGGLTLRPQQPQPRLLIAAPLCDRRVEVCP